MENETQSDPTTLATEPGATTIEKFKSGDERDKAYLALERQNGDQARRLAEIENKLDAFATMAPTAPPAPVPPQSFTDQYPSTRTQDEREAELASRILTRPSEVLANFGRQVREETMREVNVHMANQALIGQFRTEHPDLARHEEIVAMYVRKQPENLSSQQRLKLAIPEARKYLASIAGNSNQTTTLDPAAYVESPTQHSGAAPAASAATTEDDELSAMIRERSVLQAKRMRP